MNEDLDEHFSERRKCFAPLWSECAAAWATAFGLRVTLLTQTPIRVRDLASMSLPAQELKLRPNPAGVHKIDPCMRMGQVQKSPLGRVPCSIQIVDHDNEHYYHRLAQEDGLVEYLTIDNHSSVHPAYLMAVVGNALLAAEQFRRASRKPQAEYGLEIEVRCSGNVTVVDYNNVRREPTLSKLSDCLRFMVRRRDDFSSLCNQIERGLWEVWRMRPRAIPEYISVDFG